MQTVSEALHKPLIFIHSVRCGNDSLRLSYGLSQWHRRHCARWRSEQCEHDEQALRSVQIARVSRASHCHECRNPTGSSCFWRGRRLRRRTSVCARQADHRAAPRLRRYLQPTATYSRPSIRAGAAERTHLRFLCTGLNSPDFEIAFQVVSAFRVHWLAHSVSLGAATPSPEDLRSPTSLSRMAVYPA